MTPTTLNNHTSADGNVKWAFEWDKTITAGGTLIISKDMNIAGVVPEPSTLSLVGSALLACGYRHYRVRKYDLV